MRQLPHSIRRLVLPALSLGVLLSSLVPLAAVAVPPKGFQEDWPGTSLQDWGGGSLYENPGTGGVGGSGDGFLRIWTPTAYHLGTVNVSPTYQGNWITAGIQIVKVSINDVGVQDPLQIHFSFADGYTTWQYNPGFLPLHGQWTEFTVDLTQPGDFTRIIGTGTFVEALSNVERIHFRHDLAPYIHPPDLILADVGIDRLILTNSSTPAAPTTWGRIKSLYR